MGNDISGGFTQVQLQANIDLSYEYIMKLSN